MSASMIYFAHDAESGAIKIGCTLLDDPFERLAELQIGNPRELVLLGVRSGERPEEVELHGRFARARIRGEWFRLDPADVADLITARPVRRERLGYAARLSPREMARRVARAEPR